MKTISYFSVSSSRCVGLVLFSFITFLSCLPHAKGQVRILLMGDSTTKGGSPNFEDTIETLMAAKAGLPSVKCINAGRGGETCYKLLETGRYDDEISNLGTIDYIFVRYGINDWFSRRPLKEKFALDYHQLIERLKKDYPKAGIVMMTVIPFLDQERTIEVNDTIRGVAKVQKLPLFDIHPAYQKGLSEYGQNSMNKRFYPVSKIPDELIEIAKPYVQHVKWKQADYVLVDGNEIDPLLGHLPDWYRDRHPNSMGYRLLAREVTTYLAKHLGQSN